MDTDQIEGFRAFLDYGPLGLAGLMLLLVIFTLATRNPSPPLERLLKFFMIIGGLCFGAALLAQFYSVDGEHRLNLTVNPNDLYGTFPPPIIMVNGSRAAENRSFSVAADTTVLIDVSEALGLFTAVADQAETQARALAEVEEISADFQRTLSANVTRLPQREINQLESLKLQLDRTIDSATAAQRPVLPR